MILIPKIVQVLSDLLEKVKDATEVHFLRHSVIIMMGLPNDENFV